MKISTSCIIISAKFDSDFNFHNLIIYVVSFYSGEFSQIPEKWSIPKAFIESDRYILLAIKFYVLQLQVPDASS